MTNTSIHLETARFTDREIQQILDPLCGEKKNPALFAGAGSPEYDAASRSFLSVGIGLQKSTAPVADFGYVVSAGLTGVSGNGFVELQLNYSQPGLNLMGKNAIQDNFHFGYSQAIFNFGVLSGPPPFEYPRPSQGSGKPFVGLYGGLGLHVWNFSREAQEKVTGNAEFTRR